MLPRARPAATGYGAGMRRLIAAVLLIIIAGCAAPAPHGAGPDAAPPDFALVFTVTPADAGGPAEPADAAGGDPLARPAQHILTPHRVLRVAFGTGVHPGLYPPATATLTPGQVNRLWQIIREHDLTTPPAPTSPPAPAPESDAPSWTLQITAGGRWTRYTIPPSASPGAEQLLRELVQLRGGSPRARP